MSFTSRWVPSTVIRNARRAITSLSNRKRPGTKSAMTCPGMTLGPTTKNPKSRSLHTITQTHCGVIRIATGPTRHGAMRASALNSRARRRNTASPAFMKLRSASTAPTPPSPTPSAASCAARKRRKTNSQIVSTGTVGLKPTPTNNLKTLHRHPKRSIPASMPRKKRQHSLIESLRVLVHRSVRSRGNHCSFLIRQALLQHVLD